MKSTRSFATLAARCLPLGGLLAAQAAIAAGPAVAPATLVREGSRAMTFAVFAALFLLTLGITWFAARRNASAKDFYTAGGGLHPGLNGMAIAGDYLSAAAFLGVSGLIALYGLDGVSYLVGFFVSFIPVLILIAEPCRNLGRYTLGDVLAFRNRFRPTKVAVALSSILVALFYMVPQIVGGAVIVRAMIGIPYEVSVVAVGVLMLTYVMFGGMRATTSVQVLKATLLIGFCLLLVVLSWAPYGFDVDAFFHAVITNDAIREHVLNTLLKGKSSLSVADAGRQFIEPGLFLKSPLEQISLGLALVLGTAAMPHILMRFFTVRSARCSRSSALVAMLAIGACHLLIVVVGFSAALNVGPKTIVALDKGGNLAAPVLAQYLGGGADSFAGNFMLAFVAAVSFATIVAVVAGLTLAAASSLAHDVYVGAMKNGHATERQQVNAARVATLLMAVIAVVAGIAAKGQNVAQLVGLGYAVAASANLPALVGTLYWRRCNTAGVVAGVIGGTLVSIGLVLVSPNMNYPLAEREAAVATVARTSAELQQAPAANRAALEATLTQARATVARIPEHATSIVGLEKPLFSMRNPGVVSIPIGFLLVIVFSLLSRSALSESRWMELAVRRETGIGAAQASRH